MQHMSLRLYAKTGSRLVVDTLNEYGLVSPFPLLLLLLQNGVLDTPVHHPSHLMADFILLL